MDKAATEAAERIASVCAAFPLPEGQRACEGVSLCVHADLVVDPAYQDRNAYETKCTEETHFIQKMKETLQQGEQFIHMLYTFRSCSYPISQMFNTMQTSSTEESKEGAAGKIDQNEVYEAQFSVLEPEIKKLKEFMYFQRAAIKVFSDNVKRIIVEKKEKDSKDKTKEQNVVSEIYLLYLIRMLDLFALLDALKSMKGCLNNDFSFFKRALGFLRKNMTGHDDQTQENHTLYLFLAHQNSITKNLKDDLKEIERSEDVLAQCITVCANFIETERYLLPVEKHRLLRVIPYVLLLMDGEDSKHDAFKSKHLNISQLKSIFKRFPIVTVYGDMQIGLEAFIKRATHYDEKAWGTQDAKSQIEYEIVHHINTLRERHNEYLARYSAMLQDLRKASAASPGNATAVPVAMCKEVAATVLQGIQLLADWGSRIQQQAAWKYSTPNFAAEIQSKFDYERVVRYNYTPDERIALIELIAMLKSLSALILKSDPILSAAIRVAIHDELQEFIQVHLREIIRYISTSKSSAKKPTARTEVLQLRTLAVDWMNGVEPVDPAMYGKKSKEKDVAVQYPTRQVGPASTQLDLIRNIIYEIMQKNNTRKELSSSFIKQLEDFYSRSFFYPYLLDLPGTILECSDLADLWYREFFLELNHQLQFPIEMSLPWILVDHVLETKEINQHLFEYILYPFDIYNDAANRALYALKQRFLYDEVEAEVNLCFDQLLYKVAEQVYGYTKAQASSLLLDKVYKRELESIVEKNKLEKLVPLFDKLNPGKSRFDPILQQRHFQLLGRSVDLNILVGQRLVTYLRNNIDYTIKCYEGSELTAITELEHQLHVLQLTHHLLSRHVEMDSWQTIFSEVNESTSLTSYHSRILLHTVYELIADFGPNFCYNSVTQRFVRMAQDTFVDPVKRENMPKPNLMFQWGSRNLNQAYAALFEMHRKYFGMPHMLSLIRLIGRPTIPMVISECISNFYLKIVNVLSPYVAELTSGNFATLKFQNHAYGTQATYLKLKMEMREIICYPDLQNGVLQHMRDFGNQIVFLYMLDQGLTLTDSTGFMTWGPLLGYMPQSFAPDAAPDAATMSPVFTVIRDLNSKVGPFTKAPEALEALVANAWRAGTVMHARVYVGRVCNTRTHSHTH
eukprot:TRINITY_DN1906_c0_g1_i1.p1 TRINITY_DN1906_c0_g1~~TRINITY_DN1906_c0_g1_i1.p1  ORF type:complete len:1157 (+),score=386.18 TRINITY_DN1906_c0_g1_i1:74-3472(+)